MARTNHQLTGPLLDAIERRQEWQTKAHVAVPITGEPGRCEVCGMPVAKAPHGVVGGDLNHDTTEELLSRQVESLFADDTTPWEDNAADALGIELARERHPSRFAERQAVLDAWAADEAQRASDAGVDYTTCWAADGTDIEATR